MPMDQYEAAANIVFSIDGVEIPIAAIDTSKDVEIEQIRGNNLKPIGYGITEIEYSGDMTFDGNGFIAGIEVEFTDEADVEEGDVIHLEDFFTDSEGIPKDGNNITIYHENDKKQTVFEDVMVTSDGYETDTGEVSGVTFDWIAGDREREEVE